jgi:hypothetical protein
MKIIKNIFYPKKKKLYIHIGLHKTGSTSIQLFLNSNKEKIQKRHDIFYLPIPKDDIVPYQHRYLNKLMTNDIIAFREIFVKNLSKSNSFIISSECFMEKETYANQLSQIKYLYDAIYIIIYIRRQDEWIESLYKEDLINHQKYKFSIDEWVDQVITNKHMFYNPNFLSTIERWASLFGKENIILRSFDDKYLIQKNAICDFCNILKIPFNKFDNYKIHANIGLKNREIIEMFRITNGILDLNKQNELAKLLVLKESEYQSLISYEQRKKIINHFSVENEIISKKYFNNNPLFSEINKNEYWSRFNGLSHENQNTINTFIHKEHK